MAASPSTARAINDRFALRLLQDEGPLTASQLKILTGLSRPTVADLVERLQCSGLVHVVGESGAERRGPNARLYGLVADRAHLAALDVRTRSVSVTVADLLGTTLAEASVPVGDDHGTGAAVEKAVALLERTVEEAGADRLHSVAVGAPGLIDPATGELRDSSGLPAWHRRLVRVLQERLTARGAHGNGHVPAADGHGRTPGADGQGRTPTGGPDRDRALSARVLVENETNLAAVAELREGAARGREDFVLLWLGQGVGAAVVLGGRLRRGASGGAGEIGFLPVPGTSGLPSATGCDGGFHELACAAAVDTLAVAHGLDPAEALASGHGPFLDALAHRLAVGAAAVVSVVDPGCLVLAGETGHAGGTELAARVEAELAALSPLRTEVRPTTLGDAAVLRGAVLRARDAAQEELFP
ncbi:MULTISPECIES: ROK family transcriptional regulator [unclassified Streptomyces]|uniref:ROK family transcriptional regulator n=1 Tax=unclassified Streptomyces TaxID=2593676 RepID=UPI001660B7B7|nr:MULTISPECIES: ROK family transcriptional regulator [unclassified Streptomyces]MBD0711426.1 ROK family transcriptional regulator [Streptomyces sp. CBMA291]MBD0717086.1 ROK family transcriptional regulator [Streptomyces sp. CBMA370]